MVQQFAAAGTSTSFLNGIDEGSLVVQHSVDCFLDQLRGVFASAGSELLEASFFVRREMDFHATRLELAAIGVNVIHARGRATFLRIQ